MSKLDFSCCMRASTQNPVRLRCVSMPGWSEMQPYSHSSNPIQPWARHVSGFKMRHSQRSDSGLLLVGSPPREHAELRILMVYLVGAPRFCPVSGQWASATLPKTPFPFPYGHHPKPISFVVDRNRNTKQKMRVVLFEGMYGRSRAVQTATTVLVPGSRGRCHPVPTIPFLQLGTLTFAVCSLDKECGPTDRAGSRQPADVALHTPKMPHQPRDPLERDGAPPMEAAGNTEYH